MSNVDLRNVIRAFPEQIQQAIEFTKGIHAQGVFDKLIVCGMGGSALPVAIIKTYLASKKTSVPIYVSQTYQLPWQADEKSIIFISSYSGNTEEVLACYQEAKANGYTMVGFARGGQLESLCTTDQVPFVKYPDDGPDFQPRFGLGYALSAMIMVLSNMHIIPNCLEDLQMLTTHLQPTLFEEQGKQLAQRSKNAVPIFYSSDTFGESVARICKILINENSKTQAFWNVLPELNHNEMVGYTHIVGTYHILFIQNAKDHPRITKRFTILNKIFAEKNVLVSQIHMQGDSILEQICNTILTVTWMSYYLAVEYGQDPVPVVLVEEFKKKMAQ